MSLCRRQPNTLKPQGHPRGLDFLIVVRGRFRFVVAGRKSHFVYFAPNSYPLHPRKKVVTRPGTLHVHISLSRQSVFNYQEEKTSSLSPFPTYVE
jgi:hypothetical protein